MMGKTILATTSILLDLDAGNFFFENQANKGLDWSHPNCPSAAPILLASEPPL